MSISIELPAPLEAELLHEARRAGMTVEEEATFLLCLATALLDQATETPFRNSVRSILESHDIDATKVALALEELKKSSFDWRDSLVHGPVADPTKQPDQAARPIPRSGRPSILGKYAHLQLSTEDFMAEKRREIEREDRPR